MTSIQPVPDAYLGVWQRKRLESPLSIDDTSHVFWLQTSSLHADIRIPADRPSFTGKSRLQDFSIDELKLLASQQGFAGKTKVIGDTCLWERHLDYQPTTGKRDIGRMQFSGNQIVETGIDSDYSEIWQKLPESEGQVVSLRFMEEKTSRHHTRHQKGILVVSGDYFIYARDRRTTLSNSASLEALFNEIDLAKEQLIDILDLDISFGQRTQGNSPWEIQLSTLPYREGQPLLSETTWSAINHAKGIYVQHESSENGPVVRRWLR